MEHWSIKLGFISLKKFEGKILEGTFYRLKVEEGHQHTVRTLSSAIYWIVRYTYLVIYVDVSMKIARAWRHFTKTSGDFRYYKGKTMTFKKYMEIQQEEEEERLRREREELQQSLRIAHGLREYEEKYRYRTPGTK